MHRKLLTLAGAVLLSAANPAMADKSLAHSKSLGMSFTALGDPWCAATVNMRVDAEAAGTFSTPDYISTVQKLGRVLVQECPQVSRIVIAGMAGGSQAWSGSASRDGDWVAQQAVAPLAEAAPPGTITGAPAPASVDTESVPAIAQPTAQVADGAMSIAGWMPGGMVIVAGNAGKMTEITSRESGCNIHTFMEVKPEFEPVFSSKQEYTCKNGYVQSTKVVRQRVRTDFYYSGQQQPFATVHGGWYDGYNIGGYHPKQIVRRYKLVSKDQWNRTGEVEKLLVWTGEDRDLRAHYFTTYTYNSGAHQWRHESNAPFIVLTDNEQIKQNPGQLLAESLAMMYEHFYGGAQFNAVSFVIADKLHETPVHDYQLALKQTNPDPGFYKAGRAVRNHGMPWTIEVKTDFVAKRSAFVEAERQRAEMERQREEARAEAERQREIAVAEAERQQAEMERQRQAALRAQHQESLVRQYQQLAAATAYDRLRFYTTLRLVPDRLARARIDFNAYRGYATDPLSQAVVFTHPAQYMGQAKNGEGNSGGPMYMLVQARKGGVVKPYPMVVDYNETSATIDGWMLIQVAAKFGFSLDNEGRPVFEISVQEAISCKSEKCLSDMDAADMMKIWYEDDGIDFAMAGGR